MTQHNKLQASGEIVIFFSYLHWCSMWSVSVRSTT